MKVQTNPAPLENHATESFYAAAENTLLDVANAAPWKSGSYSKSLKLWRRKRSYGPTASIGSRLIYAGVLQFGGWYRGPGKRGATGVHISRTTAPRPLSLGDPSGRATAELFERHYTRYLHFTPIRVSAFVTTEFGSERGLPSLGLGG